ncbi:DUF222 domain-containing protein [Mycobacterium avium]|uniref:DUF222 domain-containing protein n=1 Tax=Mycobacterium avium TaxID=1764 RepID=UPI000A5F3356|nr:DUF222 domain-containing protein [Mycobacterium avium]
MFELSPDPAALVAVIESTHREESMLVARRFAAVAALLRHRVATTDRPEPEYAEIDGFEQTAAEVAAAMNLSAAAASYLVSYAETLDTRLPEVAALLAEGRTDWRTVRLIITRTSLVTDTELIAKLDRSLAARIGNWHGWSRQRIVNAVDAAVRTADPDAARERRLAAEEDRPIGLSAAAHGLPQVPCPVTRQLAEILQLPRHPQPGALHISRDTRVNRRRPHPSPLTSGFHLRHGGILAASNLGQFGGAAVFPVPQVVGVQSAGGATAGDRAAAVAVFEGAA